MPEGRNGGAFTIAQLSDIHCGGPDFVPNLMERAISEVNDISAVDPGVAIAVSEVNSIVAVNNLTYIIALDECGLNQYVDGVEV